MAKKIYIIGGATQDIFIRYEDAQMMHLHNKLGKSSYTLLDVGLKIDIPELHYSTGGGATNAGASLKKLGFDVSICCKISNDQVGNYILEELKKIGIDTSDVVISQTSHTALSFIVPSLDHNYTALCYRGSNTELSQAEIPEDFFKKSDVAYITALSGRSADLLPAISKKAKEHKLKVVTNPGTGQLTKNPQNLYETLPYIDILMLNAYEAEKCMRSILSIQPLSACPISPLTQPCPELLQLFMMFEDTPLSLYNFFYEIFKLGPKIVVVTHGAHGVYVGTPEFVYFHPSLPANVICSIGAGDAFGSTFVGTLLLNKSIEEALLNGLINSTSVITHHDTKEGLLTLKELEKEANRIGFSKLEKYSWK